MVHIANPSDFSPTVDMADREPGLLVRVWDRVILAMEKKAIFRIEQEASHLLDASAIERMHREAHDRHPRS